MSPRPGLGTLSTVVVEGRLSASLTGMKRPSFESRPTSCVFRSDICDGVKIYFRTQCSLFHLDCQWCK